MSNDKPPREFAELTFLDMIKERDELREEVERLKEYSQYMEKLNTEAKKAIDGWGEDALETRKVIAEQASLLTEARAALEGVEGNIFFACIEMSAWMGLPEHKREAYAKQFADTYSFNAKAALEKLKHTEGT